MKNVRTLLVPIALVAVVAAACGSADDGLGRRESVAPPGEEGPGADPAESISAEGVRIYMSQIAPYLVSRELEPAELDAIEKDRFRAIKPMLTAWTKDPAFPRAARRLISQKLSVSGTRDQIDFDLPGNLAEYVVRENLPLSTILTADYCVDAKGAKRECDSGAPYKAGVLTTRAFLASRASRFNLMRASTVLETFACQHYPMPETLQPKLPRTKLIAMFESDTETDADGKPKQTFGNGTACYTCHGQFGAHAQLFVRFDQNGTYRADATGVQDPGGEPGRSPGGLFASHLKDPAEAKDEASQFFGKPVKNLQDAARVIAESATFLPCQVRNLLEYALRVGAAIDVEPKVLDEIAAKAKAGGDVTFATLAVETFAHPRIVHAVAPVVGGTP